VDGSWQSARPHDDNDDVFVTIAEHAYNYSDGQSQLMGKKLHDRKQIVRQR